MVNGYANAVTIYLEGILNSNLDNAIKLELLLAKYEDAFLSGSTMVDHTDAISSYMSTIIGSEAIADDTKNTIRNLLDNLQP